MEGESVGHLLAGSGRCPQAPRAGWAARPLSGEGFWPSESHCGTSCYCTTVTQAGPETSWPVGGSAHLRGLWPCRRGRLRPCWTRLLSSGGPESQYVWLFRAFSAWSRAGRSPVVHGPCGKGALDWSGSLSPGLVFGHHWGAVAGDPEGWGAEAHTGAFGSGLSHWRHSHPERDPCRVSPVPGRVGWGGSSAERPSSCGCPAPSLHPGTLSTLALPRCLELPGERVGSWSLWGISSAPDPLHTPPHRGGPGTSLSLSSGKWRGRGGAKGRGRGPWEGALWLGS